MGSPEFKELSETTADSSSHLQVQIVDSFLNGDISDTGEDITTETISKGKLKHEMRMLQTRFINNATALQNNKSFSKAREEELLEQINTLSIRLNLATARYDALVEATTESTELKADLAQTIACKRRLLNENEELRYQLNSIREIIITRLPMKLEHIDATKVDVGCYSTLSSKEFDTLDGKAVNNLSTLELVKVWIHKCLCFIVQNSIQSDKKPNSESNRKHVQFVDTSSTAMPNSLSSNVQSVKVVPSVKCSSQNQLKNVNNTFLENEAEKDKGKDDSDMYKDDKAAESSIELEAVKQQLHLMKVDKEYFLKQLSNLRMQLSTAEEKITSQQKLIVDLENNTNKNKDISSTSQVQLLVDFDSYMKNQTGELTKLIQTEFERLKIIDQELYNKEMNLLRDQKESAVSECADLKSKLKQTELALSQFKERIEAMQASNKPMNIEQDNNLREQFETVLMNLEVEQAARRDTSLEVEKLNVQLDISKKSYYELEARFNHEKAIWRIKEENYEKKLQSKAITEKEISGLLLNLNSDVPESATFSKTGNLYSKPMTNTVNLLKKIQELKGEIDNLRSELVNKCQEIEELNKSINWKSFANQPTSCLYQTLSQRDSQIHVLHNQLVDTEKQAQLYKEERDKLAHERSILCEDLERLLTRRQSLAKLREFVSSLLQQIQPNLSLRLLKNQNDLLCPRDMNCGCNLTGRPSSHRETPFDHISDHNRVSNIHQQFYDILRSQ